MGYEEFTVAELINNLSGLPPMMSVFVLDEDTDEKRYVNNVEVTTSEVPVLILHISQYPKAKKDDLDHDEKVARKKELAEGLEYHE